MAEYIEREAVLDKLMQYGIGWGAARVKGVINSIPAADVAPIRRGRWVKIRPLSTLDGTYYCPCCGHETDIADGEITPIDVGFLFCPNCGAKMEETE